MEKEEIVDGRIKNMEIRWKTTLRIDELKHFFLSLSRTTKNYTQQIRSDAIYR